MTIPHHDIQRFEMIEYLGRGGMDLVVRGRDPQRERDTAVQRRAVRWRTWALAGSTAVAVAVALLVGATGAGIADVIHAPPCQLDPADRSGAEQAARLRQALSGQVRPEAGDVVERLIVDIAGQQAAIGRQQVATCRAARSGDITAAQQTVRLACLQRRRFEIAATVDLVLETKPAIARARHDLDATVPPVDCAEITGAPLDPANATAAEALWRRYVHSGVDASPARARKHVAELTAIEAAALAIGETELAARTARWLAAEYKLIDELGPADAAAQRAQRGGLDIHATHLAARALIERSDIARLRNDPDAARGHADLARALADAATTRSATRALIYHELARAQQVASAPVDAVASARKALDALHDGGLEDPARELAIRLDLGEALLGLEGPISTTIELARQTIDLAHDGVGDHDPQYAAALGLMARALSGSGDYVAAIPYDRRALEVLAATLPPDHLAIGEQRAELAIALYNSGDLRGAYRELAQLKDHAERSDRLLQRTRQLTAVAAFEVGRFDEGIALTAQAYEDAIATHGKNAAATLGLRKLLATFRLETNRLDAAASDIAAIDRGYRTAPDANQLRLAILRGTLAANLATARGKPRAAERATRQALAASAELHANDRDRAELYYSLGTSLVAQQRWAAARSALQAALGLQRKIHASPDESAAVEIELALVDAGLGDRRAALGRARRARDVLDEFPGRVRARQKADGLLGKR